MIALDEHGAHWDTMTLSKKIAKWHNDQQNISFIIGGPDGISEEILNRARIVLSLSKFTMPHKLVRIVLAEQIYRAWSVINNHPYHRE